MLASNPRESVPRRRRYGLSDRLVHRAVLLESGPIKEHAHLESK